MKNVEHTFMFLFRDFDKLMLLEKRTAVKYILKSLKSVSTRRRSFHWRNEN